MSGEIFVLLTKIENLRAQMHRLAVHKGLSDLEVLATSQKLDCVLNDFYRASVYKLPFFQLTRKNKNGIIGYRYFMV